MTESIFHLAGIGTSISLILLSFAVSRPRIVMLAIMVDTFTIIQFCISGSHAAVAVTVVALLYGIIMTQADKFEILNKPWVLNTVIAIYIITYGVVNKDTLISWELLILVGVLTSMIAMTLTNQVVVKIIQMIGNVAYLVFSIVIGAYMQIPGQLVCLALLIASLSYVIIMKKKGVVNVPEITTVIRNSWNKNRTVAVV